MGRLEEYVEKTKKYKEDNPDLTELELVKYIYLDLGKRFKFDNNFKPFGNSKKRDKIYKQSRVPQSLEECMQSNTVICVSASYILEYILKNIGVETKTVSIKEDSYGQKIKCPHTYNIIKLKDGREFAVDLQEDMYLIQSHSFTRNFGTKLEDDENYIISRFEQEQIDRKLGYIDNKNYYADDYIYLLKLYADGIKDFREKAKFVLENIDAYDNPDMDYIDRQWHHVKVLQQLFSEQEFNYGLDDGKIRIANCYKDEEDERKFIEIVSVQSKMGAIPDLYAYNTKMNQYCEIDMEDLIKAIKNGLAVYSGKIPEINKYLRKSEQEDR